jgi:predicted amidophosphoribosyltransferase
MQLVLLIVFGLLGVLAGVAQLNDSRACAYCGLEVSSSAARCPHCLCRRD